MAITGGCACGAVRYECSADPIMAANCYCRDCQHSTGTAMASVMLIPKAALKMTGDLKYFESTGDSGGKVNRGFCPNCGSPIISLISAMDSMVALKCLPPTLMLTWMVREDLPKFDQQPG